MYGEFFLFLVCFILTVRSFRLTSRTICVMKAKHVDRKVDIEVQIVQAGLLGIIMYGVSSARVMSCAVHSCHTARLAILLLGVQVLAMTQRR